MKPNQPGATKKPQSRPDELAERIRTALLELRLPVMAAQFERELENAQPTALEILWRLIEPQLIRRRERSVSHRIKAARFEVPRSLDAFDFSFQPTLDKERVLSLATLEFIRRGQNLLIGGMSGTGKSHIAIAIGYLACAAGFRTRYTTSADMLSSLGAALATHALPDALKPFVRPDVLIIDEVGLETAERRTYDAGLFYKVIRPRYEAPRSTIITSNIPWDAWGEYLQDDFASVAILDRLIHQGHLLTIEGPSYRAAAHSKLNRSRKQGTAAATSGKETSRTAKRKAPKTPVVD